MGPHQDAGASRAPGRDQGARPAYLVIQGRLRPGAGDLYAAYLAGTRPLLVKHGADIVAVGEGAASVHTGDPWPVNALLRFPTLEAAEAFLGDPEYLGLKVRLRDAAYDVLRLSLFLGRPPRGDDPAGRPGGEEGS